MENPTVLYSKVTKTLAKGAGITQGIDYTAVSHTWSMWDDVSKGILGIEQDESCKGTANFNDMIDFVETEWVWIDTLCISEDNKVTEIPNMRRYYKNAKVVLIVLDTRNRECNLGDLKVIHNLSDRRGEQERLNPLYFSPEQVTTECLPPEGVKIYETLCAMFKAEWFKRGWTFQEVLLAKDVVIWNGNSSVSGTDVKKCTDWLGTIIPDVTNNSLPYDEDYSALQRLFHIDSNNISYDKVHLFMDRRECTKEEDYVYCILGLLDTTIKVEYGINLQVCKRRLFRKLVQEQKAAVVFTHSSVGLFPIHSEYGSLAFNNDDPRSDHVVYSWCKKGVKFMGCNVYIYQALGLFPTDHFSKDYPEENFWKMTSIIGDDVCGYKDLVRAMYGYTEDDDDEFLTTKSEWFLEMANLSTTTNVDDESFDVPLNSDMIFLHSMLTQPDTPFVSFGMVHNNVSVCAYVFVCLEAEDVLEDDKCLLMAPGLIGELRETGILCSGLNPKKKRQQRIGATLNLRKDDLGTIDPIVNLLEVVLTDKKKC